MKQPLQVRPLNAAAALELALVFLDAQDLQLHVVDGELRRRRRTAHALELRGEALQLLFLLARGLGVGGLAVSLGKIQ